MADRRRAAAIRAAVQELGPPRNPRLHPEFDAAYSISGICNAFNEQLKAEQRSPTMRDVADRASALEASLRKASRTLRACGLLERNVLLGILPGDEWRAAPQRTLFTMACEAAARNDPSLSGKDAGEFLLWQIRSAGWDALATTLEKAAGEAGRAARLTERHKTGSRRAVGAIYGAARHQMVKSCAELYLAAHGRGSATKTPDGPFHRFVNAVYAAATGAPPAPGEGLERAIRDVLSPRRAPNLGTKTTR